MSCTLSSATKLLHAELERKRAAPFLLIIDSLALFYFLLSEHDAQLNIGIVRSVLRLVSESAVTVLAAKPSLLNINRYSRIQCCVQVVAVLLFV